MFDRDEAATFDETDENDTTTYKFRNSLLWLLC